MSKNPVIQKARSEAYADGFEKGQKLGFEQGKYSACMYFASRFEGLQDIKGIGPKTMQIIVKHFGSEYFQKLEQKE